jgi:hypothetical protein
MKRPPTEADKPIPDLWTSVVLNKAKDDGKLMPPSQSDYPHVRFWTVPDWRAFQNACSDTTRLKGGECRSTGENAMMPYIEEDGTPIEGMLRHEI